MSLTKEEKQNFRSILFKHQDGLSIINIITILEKTNVFNFLAKEKETTLEKVKSFFPRFHKGYLNVALRSLASQGIFDYQINKSDILIGITSKFVRLKKYLGYYCEFAKIYQIHLELLQASFDKSIVLDNRIIEFSKKLEILKKEHKNDYYFHSEVQVHLEGLLLAPIVVYLVFNAIEVSG